MPQPVVSPDSLRSVNLPLAVSRLDMQSEYDTILGLEV